MDSWADNREKKGGVSKEAKLQKIGQVNAVLRMLANDEDLQDDLKTKDVVTAINHWTGQNRLSPDEAARFQDNRRVMYVLQKFQILQSVCKEAGMAVPLDHLMSKQKELSNELIVKIFGKEFEISQGSSTGVKPAESAAVKRGTAVKGKAVDAAEKTASSTSNDATSEVVSKVQAEGGDVSVAPEQSEEQLQVARDRKVVRRLAQATVVLVMVMCVFLKWYYD